MKLWVSFFWSLEQLIKKIALWSNFIRWSVSQCSINMEITATFEARCDKVYFFIQPMQIFFSFSIYCILFYLIVMCSKIQDILNCKKSIVINYYKFRGFRQIKDGLMHYRCSNKTQLVEIRIPNKSSGDQGWLLLENENSKKNSLVLL